MATVVNSRLQAVRRMPSEKWAFAAAFGIVALFFAAIVYIATHRMFWTDEVYTTLMTRIPTWAGLWQASVHSADTMSFGYDAVARIFDRWLGPGEIGIRLPSAIAVTLGILVAFDCARRFSDAWHGLIAVGALLCSFVTGYAYQGRAYGLYYLFAALALWCWLSRRSPLLLAIVFFAGVLMHYYMVFCIVPLAVAEALEKRSWRIAFSPRLLSAGTGALLAIACLWPQISYARRYLSPTFWAKPALTDVAGVYEKFFPLAPLMIAVALIAMAIFAGRKSVVPAMSDGERVAWLFLLIPMVVFVAAKLVTNAYLDRYVIGTLPGAAVGIACLVHRLGNDEPRFSKGILLLVLAVGGWRLFGLVTHAQTGLNEDYMPELHAILSGEDDVWRDGKQFIVTPEGRFFLTARYYSRHPERYVALPENPPNETRYFPLPAWNEQQLIAHARECALVEPKASLLAELGRAGLRLTVRKASPLTVYLE